MTVLRAMGRALTERHVLPESESALQRLHLLDTVIAGLSGIHTSEGSELRALFAGQSLAECGGLCAATVRLSEIDDIHLPSCTTPSSVAVPTALVLAANLPNISRRQLQRAIWAGTELMVRFGRAIDGAYLLYSLNRSVWPSYVAAPLSAAATAACLLDLDEAASAHALSLALVQSAGAIGRPLEPRTARWFLFASAVTAGVRAAQAAKAGLQGDLSLLDSDWFERTRGIKVDAETLTRSPADVVYATLSQKPYCTGRQCLAAGQAFRLLIDEGLDPVAATAIRVRVPPVYAGMISVKPDRTSRSSSIIGAPMQLAIAGLQPDGRYRVDRSPLQADEALSHYAERVTVIPDESLQAYFPLQWPATVEVDTAKGTLIKRVIDAHGDPNDRLTEAELKDKGHATLDIALGRAVVDAWIEKAMAAFYGETDCRHFAQDFVAAMNGRRNHASE